MTTRRQLPWSSSVRPCSPSCRTISRNELRQRREVIENVALRMVARVELGDFVFQFDEIGRVFEIAGDVVSVIGHPVAQRAIRRGAGVFAEVVARPLAEILFGEFVVGETENGKLARAEVCCGRDCRARAAACAK